MPMHYINGNGHIGTEKQQESVINHTKSKSCHWLFMALRVDTHTYMHLHTYPDKNDLRKPGTHRPMASLRLV